MNVDAEPLRVRLHGSDSTGYAALRGELASAGIAVIEATTAAGERGADAPRIDFEIAVLADAGTHADPIPDHVAALRRFDNVLLAACDVVALEHSRSWALPDSWDWLPLPATASWLRALLGRARERATKRCERAASDREAADLRERLMLLLRTAGLTDFRYDLRSGMRYPGAMDWEVFGASPTTFDEALSHVHADDRERYRQAYLRAITSGEAFREEIRVRARDRRYRWVLSVGVVVGRDRHRPGELIGVTWDIDVRREAEELARSLRERLERVLEAGSMIAWDWNFRTDHRFALGPQERVLGVSPRNVSEADSIVHVNDRQRDAELLLRAVESGEPYCNEFRIVRPDGTIRWLRSLGSRFSGSGRTDAVLSGIAIDVTDLCESRNQIAVLQQRLEDALRSASMFLCEWDLELGDHRIIGDANVIVGIESPTLQQLASRLIPDDGVRLNAAIRACIESDAPFSGEYRLQGASGGSRWLRIECQSQRAASGSVGLLRGAVMDISRLRESELRNRELDSRLHLALEAAALNPWSVDLVTGAHASGPLDEAFFGRRIRSRAMFLEHVVDDDQDAVAALDRLGDDIDGRPVYIEFRVRHVSGMQRWLAVHARVVSDADGRASRLLGVSFDITARKHAEQLLAERQTQLDTALAAGRMVMWHWTPDAGFVGDFGVFQQFFGAPQLPVSAFVGLIHPDDRERVARHFDQCMRTLAEYRDNYRIALPDGDIRWMHAQGRPEVRGDVRAMSGLLIDITDQRRTEQALARAGDRLEDALRAADMRSWELLVPRAEALAALPLPEAFGATNPISGAQVRTALVAAMQSGQDIDVSYRVEVGDDGVGWRQVLGRRFQSATATGLSGVCLDITKRKHMEAQITESLRWREMAVESAGLNVWETDIESGRRRGGAMDLQLYGRSPTHVSEIEALIHPHDYPLVDAVWSSAIQTGEPYRVEYRLMCSDGEYRWVSVRGRAVHDEYSGRRIMTGVTIDIHERKQVEVELERAVSAANRASEAKSSFLASMSHEIRTPLNAIIGYTGLLLETSLLQQQRTYVNTLKKSGEQLLYLINDILDFSRIEAGELPLEEAPFSLLECLESSLDFVATHAESKGLCLTLTSTGPVDTLVAGDVSRLRQVVVNLLSNAVKFTESGAVCCGLKVGIVEQHASVHVCVNDTGIGMDAHTIAELFRPFRQGDTSTSRRFGGTGLGLSISHRLIELMGGRFGVSSELGLGSQFHIELLLPWAETQSSSPVTIHPPTPRLKVGVRVKSSELHAALVRQLVEFGHDPVPLAVDAINPSLATAGLDALVIGYPLLQAVEALDPYPRAGSGEPLGLVVLHGIAEGSTLSTGKHGQTIVGIERVIKPSRLRTALEHLIAPEPFSSEQAPTRQASEAQQLPAANVQHWSVLIVEDNAVNQTLTRVQVESLGYPCHVVSSGVEALLAMDIREFDIVLMDLEMPDMDGFTSTHAIRTRPEARPGAPYVIAVTAHASRDITARISAAGMDDYVAKPVLMAKLHEALARATARLSDVRR